MVNFGLSNDITIDIKSIPLSEGPFQIEVPVLSFGFQVGLHTYKNYLSEGINMTQSTTCIDNDNKLFNL
ncbi:MAG: hypothetical protein AB7U98_08190 [Candidatus Nitrosocosmicus sp.]